MREVLRARHLAQKDASFPKGEKVREASVLIERTARELVFLPGAGKVYS